MQEAFTPVLSPRQLRFVSEHHAQPGLPTVSGIYFYHEDRAGTDRWLVDAKGQVLDFERFHWPRA